MLWKITFMTTFVTKPTPKPLPPPACDCLIHQVGFVTSYCNYVMEFLTLNLSLLHIARALWANLSYECLQGEVGYVSSH